MQAHDGSINSGMYEFINVINPLIDVCVDNVTFKTINNQDEISSQILSDTLSLSLSSTKSLLHRSATFYK